ncbi:hypothetical protein FACS189475_07640 [Betaproteobacteria bacterium]|nr:hypothetical protein FACS189475_07640 [Betaproteobacteria bacterium]
MSAPHSDFPNEYYHDADLRLARAILEDSRDILGIGCGEGRPGEFLKRLLAQRRITGMVLRATPVERNGEWARFGEDGQENSPPFKPSYNISREQNAELRP